MYRVVFTSRATRRFNRAEIKALCEAAAEKNRVEGITGLFLYDGSRFLQALEGQEVEVVALMRRIAANPMHYDLEIVIAKEVERREFHDWSMSQPLYGVGDDPDAYVNRIKYELRHVTDHKLKAHFIGFASLARSARLRYE